MAISGIASSSAYDSSAIAADMATRVVKQLDTDQDGGVSKSEYLSGMANQGVSAEESGKQFDALDAKQTGSIGQTEIESAIKLTLSQEGMAASRSDASSASDKGAPPAGGGDHGGAGGAGGTSSASSSSSSETYDPADTNEDGTVSELEQLLYSLTHADTTSSTATTSAASLGNTVDVQA